MVANKLNKLKKNQPAVVDQSADVGAAVQDAPPKRRGKKLKGSAEVMRGMDLSKTKNWYNDRYQAVVVQRNVLFFVTILALSGLILSVFAVAALNNRKTFEPFVIEVEDKTGIVTQVSASSLERYKADEVMMRYFIVQYVQARESYAEADFNRYLELVRLMSDKDVYTNYIPLVSSTNEESPYHLGKNAVRDVAIKSISVLDPASGRVQVRIRQSQTPLGSRRPDWVKHYIITLTYEYKNMDFAEAERLQNPLGFTITSYRSDRDSGEIEDEKYSK